MRLEQQWRKTVMVLTLAGAAACHSIQPPSTAPGVEAVPESTSVAARPADGAGSPDTVRANRDSLEAQNKSDTTGMSWGRRVLLFYEIIGFIGMTVMAVALWR
jgi:hypothetical protein